MDRLALIAERHRADVLARLHAPRLTLGALLAATGVSAAAFQGWRARGLLPLDADTAREPGAHRRYSALDAARVALAADCAALGLNASRAGAVAGAVTRAIEAQIALTATGAALLFNAAEPLLIDVAGASGPRVFAGSAAPARVSLLRIDAGSILNRVAAAIGNADLAAARRAAA